MTTPAGPRDQAFTTTPDRAALTGWAHTSPTVATVYPAGADSDLAAALVGSGSCPSGAGRGVLARGLGRSYGDAAQNGGGHVVDMTGRSRILDIDLPAATVHVEAGISLDRLLRTLLPLGLTLPVQPGTRQVTVGGAVAGDIHGKNHHRVGSFGDFVDSLRLLTPDGEVRDIGPRGPDHDLFWATVGGLGLTGIVLRARLRVRRVETSYVVVRTERCNDLPTVMDTLRRRDQTAEYSVAWFDSITRGRGAGRGIVLSGHDAGLHELSDAQRERPLHLPSEREVRVPPVPTTVVNGLSGRVFNELWFRRAPREPTTDVQHSFGFFQPLDGLAQWHRLYGPRGLVQYQLVVPEAAEQTVVEVVETIAASGHVSCLNVLKRFGPSGRGLLSFPAPGWTLAVDLPVRPGLAALLDRLDRLVLRAGGRVYLTKDSRLAARDFAAMYPRADDFAEIRGRVDPHGVLQSDLSRRLAVPSRTGGAP